MTNGKSAWAYSMDGRTHAVLIDAEDCTVVHLETPFPNNVEPIARHIVKCVSTHNEAIDLLRNFCLAAEYNPSELSRDHHLYTATIALLAKIEAYQCPTGGSQHAR